jgi:hypothetical protein
MRPTKTVVAREAPAAIGAPSAESLITYRIRSLDY